MKRENDNIKIRLEDVETYQRGDTLVLSGSSVPTASAGEDCVKLAATIFKDQLKHTPR